MLHADHAADVDLTAMPPEAISLVRAHWQTLLAQPVAAVSPERQCVVHGDFGPGDVLIDDHDVGIIDWDEARVDVPAFDLAALPEDALTAQSRPGDLRLLRKSALAWEVATCWTIEPDYARRCLSELQGP